LGTKLEKYELKKATETTNSFTSLGLRVRGRGWVGIENRPRDLQQKKEANQATKTPPKQTKRI